MWSLALLFKRSFLKYLIALLLLISLPCLADLSPASLANSSGKLIEKDVAAFRVQNKIVFLSELSPYISHLNTFRCFKEDSILLDALKLDKLSMPKVLQFKTNSADELANRAPIVKKIVSLLKAQLFANKQRVSVEGDFIKSLGVGDCISGAWDNWPNELRSMVQAELFFRDRFKREDSSVLETSKFKASMEEFLETIEKKIEHDLFF
jgi:hypothetical protein